MPIHTDSTLLQMALVGYEAERQKIQAKIDEIKARIGGRRGRPAVAPTASPAPRARRQMSAAGRRKIAAAQKKRWAEYRKKKAA
jgi:hypothetical protein